MAGDVVTPCAGCQEKVGDGEYCERCGYPQSRAVARWRAEVTVDGREAFGLLMPRRVVRIGCSPPPEPFDPRKPYARRPYERLDIDLHGRDAGVSQYHVRLFPRMVAGYDLASWTVVDDGSLTRTRVEGRGTLWPWERWEAPDGTVIQIGKGTRILLRRIEEPSEFS